MNPYGTSHAGERHYRHVLTDARVARLRALAHARRLVVVREARRYGVTVPCVIRAVKGFTWRHVRSPRPATRDLRFARRRA